MKMQWLPNPNCHLNLNEDPALSALFPHASGSINAVAYRININVPLVGLPQYVVTRTDVKINYGDGATDTLKTLTFNNSEVDLQVLGFEPESKRMVVLAESPVKLDIGYVRFLLLAYRELQNQDDTAKGYITEFQKGFNKVWVPPSPSEFYDKWLKLRKIGTLACTDDPNAFKDAVVFKGDTGVFEPNALLRYQTALATHLSMEHYCCVGSTMSETGEIIIMHELPHLNVETAIISIEILAGFKVDGCWISTRGITMNFSIVELMES